MLLLFYGTALLPSLILSVTGGIGGSRMGRPTLLFVVHMVLFFCVGILLSAGNGSRRWQKTKRKPLGGGHYKEKWPVLRKPISGIVLAAVILLLHPVSDWFYYIGAFGCMGTVFWAILDMIKQHNLLATRKLPQLNRRGGDDNG